jgi:hypothetical protein
MAARFEEALQLPTPAPLRWIGKNRREWIPQAADSQKSPLITVAAYTRPQTGRSGMVSDFLARAVSKKEKQWHSSLWRSLACPPS